MRKIIVAAVVAAGLQIQPPHLSSPAVADPVPRVELPAELLEPATVVRDGEPIARLDAGDWLVPGARWNWLDAELRRLQEAETRLEAENESMRDSLRSRQSTWYWVAGAFATGLAAARGYDEVRSWL